MDILKYFEHINLTKDQRQALLAIEAFIEGPNLVFILKGYAGTGKTTLLKGLINYLDVKGRLGHVMAPTGRAAKVIKEKTDYAATTIHKGIYNFNELKSFKSKVDNSDESYKYFYALHPTGDKTNQVYLIDEGSMVGNRFSEGEFFRFGSGRLLNDLISYTQLGERTGHKLIIVGDPAQLPPVGDSTSPALEMDTFKEYGIEEFELMEVVRQQGDSGIQKNAAYYRRLIFSDVVSENCLDTSFEDTQACELNGFIKKYLAIAPVPNMAAAKIICYSNALASSYNNIIRNSYFPEGRFLEPGDVLQVVQNHYSGEVLFNGDFIKVISIDPHIHKLSASVYDQKQRRTVELEFVSVKVMHGEGIIEDKLILLNLLTSNKAQITSLENRALYVNFVMRCSEKPGSEEFGKALKADLFFNALRVKYGYAITGHKSQGGEWPHVFVDFEGCTSRGKDQLRWAYTSLTRAAQQLYVIHPPLLRQMSFKTKGQVSIGKVGKLPLTAANYPDVEAGSWHAKEVHPCKRLKYFELLEKFTEQGWLIKDVRSQQYQETYTVECNESLFKFDLYHNESGVFKPVHFHPGYNNEQLKSLIDEVVPWKYSLNYQPQTVALNSLHQNILEAITESECSIMHVDDSNLKGYQLSYVLRTKAQGAYLQFYFNGQDVFTSIIAKSLIGEDDLQLRQVINHLLQSN